MDDAIVSSSEAALPSSVCKEDIYQPEGWLTAALYAPRNHQKNHDICIMLNIPQFDHRDKNGVALRDPSDISTGPIAPTGLNSLTGQPQMTAAGRQAAQLQTVVRQQVDVGNAAGQYHVPQDCEPAPYIDYYVLHHMIKMTKSLNSKWRPKHTKAVVDARRSYYHAFQVWLGVINQCMDLYAYDRILRTEFNVRKAEVERELEKTGRIDGFNDFSHAQSVGIWGFDEGKLREIDASLRANKNQFRRERENEKEARLKRNMAAQHLVLVKKALLTEDMPALVRFMDVYNKMAAVRQTQDTDGKETDRPENQIIRVENKKENEPPCPKSRARKRKADGPSETPQVPKGGGRPKKQHKSE